jgi:hypothetical protein
MSEDSILRLIGGVYLALSRGLSPEEAAMADGFLYDLARQSPKHDREILKIIADFSSGRRRTRKF